LGEDKFELNLTMATAKEGELPMAIKTNKNYALSKLQERTSNNKPQQEGITTKPGYKELFILILQKTSNNN